MIPQCLVDEARRLLAEGRLSQRRIAKKLGISRGTIGAIASGRRPDYPARRGGESPERLEPTGPPERCPGCGGLVFMPCRVCLTRAARARRSAPAPGDAACWVALELKPHHRARYEQVRARRREIERCIDSLSLG